MKMEDDLITSRCSKRVATVRILVPSCLNDVGRRNTIATLMSDWGLLTVDNKEQLQPIAPLRQIKIISFKDKDQWELCPKYNIGNGTK